MADERGEIAGSILRLADRLEQAAELVRQGVVAGEWEAVLEVCQTVASVAVHVAGAAQALRFTTDAAA